jgi:signal transduction histidine kinase
VEGDPTALDQGVKISLYRIAQEALTNVRKHAPGARATVIVRYLPQAVEVDVTNDGALRPAPSEAPPGAGQGLVGIRERAAVFGGSVDAGPTEDGGFDVRVRLPFELVPA